MDINSYIYIYVLKVLHLHIVIIGDSLWCSFSLRSMLRISAQLGPSKAVSRSRSRGAGRRTVDGDEAPKERSRCSVSVWGLDSVLRREEDGRRMKKVS